MDVVKIDVVNAEPGKGFIELLGEILRSTTHPHNLGTLRLDSKLSGQKNGVALPSFFEPFADEVFGITINVGGIPKGRSRCESGVQDLCKRSCIASMII